MNTAEKFILAADITLTAPLHITALESGRYDPARRTILRFDSGDQGIGCSLTRTMSLLNSGGEESGKGGLRVPVIPASTLAGKLRRAATDMIADALVERNLQISADAFNTMASGTATTDIKADSVTPKVSLLARRHPFVGLFGGTSLMVPSSAIICEGWPLLQSTAGCLLYPAMEPLMDISNYHELTEAYAIVRKNALTSNSTDASVMEKLIGVTALADYFREEGERRAKSRASRGTETEPQKKTDLRSVNAMECVKTGLAFALRIAVTAHTPAQLGLMALSLQRVLRAGVIGGHSARGFGQFTCNYSRFIEVDPRSNKAGESVLLFGNRAANYGIQDSPKLTEAVQAAREFLETVDPATLNAFGSGDVNALLEKDKT